MAPLSNKIKKQLNKKINNKLYRHKSSEFTCSCGEKEFKDILISVSFKEWLLLLKIVKELNIVLKQPSLIFPYRLQNKTTITTAVKATRTKAKKTTITTALTTKT